MAKLNDPEVLKTCIPGCEEMEKTDENSFRAVAKMKVGPVSARFKGRVTLSDLDPPNGYKISGEGEGGVAGFAKFPEPTPQYRRTKGRQYPKLIELRFLEEVFVACGAGEPMLGPGKQLCRVRAGGKPADEEEGRVPQENESRQLTGAGLKTPEDDGVYEALTSLRADKQTKSNS